MNIEGRGGGAGWTVGGAAGPREGLGCSQDGGIPIKSKNWN